MSIYLNDGKLGKILTDLIALRRAIGGFQAKKLAAGPQYPVKNAKELFIKLREEGDVLGMPMVGSIVHQNVMYEPTDKGSKCIITSTVRFMSSDGTYVDFVGSGGGQATDDKAAGKANTYSKKVACFEGLALPDKELIDTDDEELHTNVYDLIGELQRTMSMDELKALKPKLEALKPHEREAVLPTYIKMAAAHKNGVE